MNDKLALTVSSRVGGVSMQLAALAARHDPSTGPTSLAIVNQLLAMAQELNAVVADCLAAMPEAAGSLTTGGAGA